MGYKKSIVLYAKVGILWNMVLRDMALLLNALPVKIRSLTPIPWLLKNEIEKVKKK